VISKLNVQLRTPTSIEEEAQQVQSWTSRTPRTVLEARPQSEYLQGRIKRYHSSSLDLILEALRSLFKGTKAVMHKVALLAGEIKTFEKQMRYLAAGAGQKDKPTEYREDGSIGRQVSN
jgi:spore germination protein GerM